MTRMVFRQKRVLTFSTVLITVLLVAPLLLSGNVQSAGMQPDEIADAPEYSPQTHLSHGQTVLGQGALKLEELLEVSGETNTVVMLDGAHMWLARGTYQVSVSSTLNVSWGLPDFEVNKVVVWANSEGHPEGWYWIVEEGSPATITIPGSGTTEVYAFLLDTDTGNNTGSATVTFDALFSPDVDTLEVSGETNTVVMLDGAHMWLARGTYQVSVSSTLNVSWGLPDFEVNKVVVWANSEGHPEGWYWIVEEGSPATITIPGSGTTEVYAFLLDTDTGNNIGSATVTFSTSPLVCGGEVDVVFAMDTSGSMNDEFSALCTEISDVVAGLSARGLTVEYDILGIDETRDCATQSVSGLIPGGTVDHTEDWGPAVVDLSNYYAWEPGYTRLIIPMSDEGPQDGSPEDDPGPDREAIIQACAAARSSNVLVSPVQGTATGSSGDPAKVEQLMRDLASCTGGLYFRSKQPASDLADALANLIGTASCTPVIASITPDCDILASTVVTIIGQNFQPDATVELCPVGGGSCIPAENVTVVSDTQITFQIPSSLPSGRPYGVLVTNLGTYDSALVTIWVGPNTCRNNIVYFDPQHSSASFCNTTSVDIKVDAANFKSGQIKFTYNSGCANVTGWTRNTSSFPMGTWESGTPGQEWITFSAAESLTGIYTIGTLTIHCESQDDCTTPLDFLVGGSGTSKLFDDWGSEVSATWQDGTFECNSCICGDVAPYPGCDGQINMGDVSLLHSYVGHPGQYSLCCESAGDVAPYPTCDGQINMGDVSLLHSFVGHPGQYHLCCETGVSSASVPAVPAAAGDEASFVPRQSNASVGGTTQVDIQVDAHNFKSGQVKFTYDATCADVMDWDRNTSDFTMGTWESGTSGEEWITFSAQDAITGAYSIGTLTIRCTSEEPCTTALDFVQDGPMTSKLFDDWGTEISTVWQDGTFEGGYGVYLPIVTKV